jgi:hypothetical protein
MKREVCPSGSKPNATGLFVAVRATRALPHVTRAYVGAFSDVNRSALSSSGGDMKRISVLIVICSALSACISAGVDVKPEQLSKFKQEVTTLEEVVTELGSPTAQTALRDGSTVLIYSFVTSRPRPESFIPFIGPLFGGADTQSSTVVFEFDENGILTRVNAGRHRAAPRV